MKGFLHRHPGLAIGLAAAVVKLDLAANIPLVDWNSGTRSSHADA